MGHVRLGRERASEDLAMLGSGAYTHIVCVLNTLARHSLMSHGCGRLQGGRADPRGLAAGGEAAEGSSRGQQVEQAQGAGMGDAAASTGSNDSSSSSSSHGSSVVTSGSAGTVTAKVGSAASAASAGSTASSGMLATAAAVADGAAPSVARHGVAHTPGDHTSYLEAQAQPPTMHVQEYWHRFKRSDRYAKIKVCVCDTH